MTPDTHTHDNSPDEDPIRYLLHQALPRIGDAAQPRRDLWPDLLKRLDEKPAPVPWFDWALLAGLLGVVVFIPASIPVLLYYL
jgi:hypothetical protein